MSYMEIGSSPCDEGCAQVGEVAYAEKARIECKIFAAQLSREFPDGDFRVKSFPHDFGTYYEVVAFWQEDGDSQYEAAFAAEGDANPKWDELSLANLRDKYVADWIWTRNGWQVDPLGKVMAVTGMRNAGDGVLSDYDRGCAENGG